MKKIILSVLFVFLIIAIILAAIRYISGEDDWICVKGEWVKHGHPNAPAPAAPCNLYEK